MASIAVAAGSSAATPNLTPTAKARTRTPAPGQRVVVTGQAQTSYGKPLTLEFAPSGSSDYQPIGRTTVGHGDLYRVTGRPPGAGTVRVSVVPNGRSDTEVSHAIGVRVVRTLTVGSRRLHVRTGHAAIVRGRGAPGETVRLQARRDGRWATLDRARVRRGGAFVTRARLRLPTSVPVRVAAGGRTRSAGRLNVYRSAEASWYGPGLYGGHLACGGTLEPGTLGVANKSLPCGAKLTLRHGSRSIRVRVVDRGPYVGNREFDLTAATAHRLHFGGVGTILTTR